MKKIVLLAVLSLASCAIPPSTAVQAHAAGEVFSPVSFAAKSGPVRSPESDKADAFWGRSER